MSILSTIVSPITDLAGTYLQGKTKIAGAKIDYEVAKFEAKALLAKGEMEHTFSLDRMAMEEARGSWWDEGICLLPLGLMGYALLYAFMGEANSWTDPQVMYTALQEMPVELQVLIGLVYVRYLGFRNLLRLYLRGKFGLKNGGQTKADGSV